MLDFVFKNLTQDIQYNSKFFEKILVVGIKELKFDDKSIGVGVSLVGEVKMRELNKKYRKKDKVTDVLSFPMSEAPLKNLKFLDLGDIFICLSFAKKEAKSENVSIDSKLAQLTVHGFLHLAGYDHERSGAEEKKMLSLENSILAKCLMTKD